MSIQESLNLAESLHRQALVQSGQGDFDRAIENLRRAAALCPNSPEIFTSLVIALCNKGDINGAVAAAQWVVRLRPESANAHHNFGKCLALNGRFDEAIAAQQTALRIKPDFVEAANVLGATLRNQAETRRDKPAMEEAIAAFRHALTLKPDFIPARMNLGNALFRVGRLDEAIAAHRTALALDPNLAEVHNNLGNAYLARGDLDQALSFYQAAIDRRPDFAGAHWNLSHVFLLRGDFEHGWPLYEWRWKVPGLGLHPNVPGPQWDGDDLKGKRILLHADQSPGDLIHFIRYVPMVQERGGKVILACHRELHRLFATIGSIEQWIDFGQALPEYDVHCPMMSLAGVFKTTLSSIPANIPYLSADPAASRTWAKRVPQDGRLKVGLVWSGGPEPMGRSVPAQALSPIAHFSNLWLCSLQKWRKDVTPDQPSLTMMDWTSELNDFADTAALIDNLDLVITIDTSVAHLAGAMGKNTWVLLKKTPDWRWMLDRCDSPWYPTMRLFRQEQDGNWTKPMADLVRALETL